jgi:hypothetical protein
MTRIIKTVCSTSRYDGTRMGNTVEKKCDGLSIGLVLPLNVTEILITAASLSVAKLRSIATSLHQELYRSQATIIE